MLHIVTGGVGSGKSARMRELFSHTPGAGGVLSGKIMDGGIVLGYRILCPATDENALLALREEAFSGQFSIDCSLGPYVFSREAFALGNRRLLEACADDAVAVVFLDEAGPLELRGEGFAPALPEVLRCGKDVYIAVRGACLDDFLQKYGVVGYERVSAG